MPVNKTKLKSVLESLLFVSGEPVTIAKISKICDIAKQEIETAFLELSAEYENNRGICIIRKGDTLQMATTPENVEFVSKLVSGEMSSDLSKSALETISIIAYKGPVTRMDIEAIRGVNCSYVLRSLLMRGLVERKENISGRGYSYEISLDFLKYLGIKGVQDLPDWSVLSRNETVDSAVKNAYPEEKQN